MLIARFATALLLLTGFAHAADVCHPEIKTPADAAEAKQQLAGMQSLLPNATDRQTVLYLISTTQAHLGDWDDAYRSLQSAVDQRPSFDPSGEAAFKPVLNCPIVQQVVAKIRASNPLLPATKLYRMIAQPDLIPEGLAADPSTGDFYLSSIFHRKILRIDRKGSTRDFISSGQEGTLAVLGIRIDPRDRTVWANSQFGGKSWLHHWDRSGKLIARYSPDATDKHEHLFNDLVVTRSGDVYLTDSTDNSLFKLPNGEKNLQRIPLPNAFYPNGIALSDDEKRLYVSDAFDLFLVDLSSNAIRRIAPPKGVSIAGFDGLYFYKNSLIGIQNGVGTPRVLQVKLSPDGARALDKQILDYGSPMVSLPTTGAIYEDRFYFIANSQLDQEQNGKIKNRSKLQPVNIVVVPLPK